MRSEATVLCREAALPEAGGRRRPHGHAVGFVTSADYEEEQARYGFVIQVGVHPRWRGQKLGAALISHALLAWRSAGKGAVILDVNLNNPGVLRLYLQLGFEAVRRRGKFSRSKD